MEDYEDLLDGATSELTYPEIDEFDACGMCYTSGTTGKPKASRIAIAVLSCIH